MNDEYPKIETLFNRDPKTFKVIPRELRMPEFSVPSLWHITEKIDGTNVRVFIRLDRGGCEVGFGGRTDNAQMPTFLYEYLGRTFEASTCAAAFEEAWGGKDESLEATLYGEGYGPKIQKGGMYRDEGPSFRLFDVRVGPWWLDWPNVEDVAAKLGVKTVPVLNYGSSLTEAQAYVDAPSVVQHDEFTGDSVNRQEGIVARTDPLLFDRRGHRLMWKLKNRDLA